MAQTKVSLIKNGVVTVDNLHTNHGITTDHIGEGSTRQYFTTDRVQSFLTTNNYIKTTDVASLETTTSLSLNANILSYVDEAGNTTNIDLSLYLDDSNLARIVSGSLNPGTGVATFTRDDSSTFTVDFSAFLSDANDYVTSASFNTTSGVLTLTRLGGGTVTVDLDGKYSVIGHNHDDRYYTETESDARFLGIGAKAADSNLLDGIDSSSFVRSDANDTITGNILINTGATQNGIRFRTTSGDFVGRYSNYVSLYNQTSGGEIRMYDTDYIILDSPDVRVAGNHQVIHGGNIGSQSVNYASSAGNADTVDGYHASNLWRSDGATWNPSANVTLNQSANSQEWSFDIIRNGYSGGYWQVWDSSNSTMLKVDAVNGKVYAPYNFVGNLEGNASSASSVAWGNVSGKPSTFTPSSHNHDDRYYTESESNSRFTSRDHFRSTGTGYYTSTTTSALITEALGDGAFDSYLTAHKTGWSYAGNGNLTDAGRLTELAGSSWLWWTDNPADGTQGNITGLCIAPNTGGSAGKVFIYNNQGSSYNPGWREVWTSSSDGSGSGLDADLLDGQHASAFAPAGGSYGTDWYANAVYYDDWVRNHQNNNGLYWSGTGWHLYPKNSSDFYLQSGASDASIQFRRGSTASAYIHNASDNAIGFLTTARSWSLRADDAKNVWAYGSMRSPIFYDDNNTAYYVDPASTSNFNGITSQGESNFRTKRHYFGLSNNWDVVGVSAQTNVHFQGHNQFWVGAGNGTWFTGAANSKSATSGLSADASYAHDLLITTMQSTSAYDRGITFAVDNAGNGNSGWRLGKWHAGDAYDSSKLTVDGGLFVKGGYTDEFEYYADDYSAYYSSQGGTSYWTGGTNAPSITASTAIQIQAGNKDTNARNPQLQFHQYGYGGVQFRYDGPNDRMYLEPLGTNRFDWYRNQTDHGYIDFGPANSSHAHIYTDRGNFYFNKQLTVSGGSQINSGDIRAGVLYDINDTNVRLDSTRLVLRGTDPTVIFRDTDHTSAMWHVNSHKMYLLRGNGDTESWTQVSGQWPVYWDLGNNNAYFGGTVVATNAVTAPIFYDSNNTSYYVNPASTSVMQKVLSYDGYKCNTEKGMVGNYDAAGTADKIIWTIGDSWNSLGSHYGIGYDYDGTYGHHLVFRNNGTAYSRIPFASQAALFWGGVKAPVFYDSNDTAYYCDPATQSNLKAVTLSGTTNTGYINCYHSGTYGYAMNMEFAGSSSSGLAIKNNRGSTGDGIAFIYGNAPQPPRGNISISSTGVSYNSVSDYRAKENVTPLTGAIDRLSLLKPSRFNFIGDGETVDGFLAHEVQEVVPQAVNGEKDAVDQEGNDLYQSMDASKMVPLLTAALQEAIAKIESLEARIQVLENQ